MRRSCTHRIAWLAAIGLALAPAVALAADAGQPRSTLGRAKVAVSDTWLTTKVKSALLTARQVSGTAIHVETSQGIVTLTGTVETEEVRLKASQIASEIDGVLSVRNDLRVSSGGPAGAVSWQ